MYISLHAKNLFKTILKGFTKEMGNKPIVFKKFNDFPSPFNEDISNLNNPSNYTTYTITGILNYNYMRTWPISNITGGGERDNQSVQLFLNKQILGDLGLLSINNNFNYNPDYDRFIIDGIPYKAMGDTSASQIAEDDINFLVILERMENNTGEFTRR